MSVNNNKKSCNKTDGQRLKKETVKIKVKNANGEKNEIKSKKMEKQKHGSVPCATGTLCERYFEKRQHGREGGRLKDDGRVRH